MGKPKGYKCVLGENPSMPNLLQYWAQMSNKDDDIWIGWCKGDKTHEAHFIKIIKNSRYQVLRRDKNAFRSNTGKDLGKRLFERQKKLRCPSGRVYMILKKKETKSQPFSNLDIYNCVGNLKGGGHRSHLVKLLHGTTDFVINQKKVGVLIVTIEI
jgi:hypothetical protein